MEAQLRKPVSQSYVKDQQNCETLARQISKKGRRLK